MTLIFPMNQWGELIYRYPCTSNLDAFETCYKFPEDLGHRFIREIELSSEIWLVIANYRYRDDVMLKAAVHKHLVQFIVDSVSWEV